jgi:hypothetical protein
MTRRGLMLLVAFAVIWLLLLKYPVYQAAGIISDPNYFDDFVFFSQLFDLQYLLNWQSPELAIYWLIAALIFPLTSVLFSSDQIATDQSRGTLRFISLRASRHHILFGRFFAQLLIISLLIMMTASAALLMTLKRDPSLITAASVELLTISANLIVLCLPFIALMTLFNCIFKSARLSVVATVIVIPIASSLISVAALALPMLELLLVILPGQQLTTTLQANTMSSVSIAVQPLVQTIVYLALAQQIFARRAL